MNAREELVKLIKDTGINWATDPELLADTILEAGWVHRLRHENVSRRAE